MNIRTNKVNLIVGTRGTGKTDFLKNLLFKLLSFFDKTLIVDTFDSDVWRNMGTFLNPDQANTEIPILPVESFPRWKKGLARMFSSDIKSMMDTIEMYGRNTNIVFEDSTKYIGSKLSNRMYNFILDSKQKNLDLTFVFHSLAAVPPDLVRVADTLTLFKTNEGDASKSKYPFPEINMAMQRLRASKNRYAHETILLN